MLKRTKLINAPPPLDITAWLSLSLEQRKSKISAIMNAIDWDAIDKMHTDQMRAKILAETLTEQTERLQVYIMHILAETSLTRRFRLAERAYKLTHYEHTIPVDTIIELKLQIQQEYNHAKIEIERLRRSSKKT